MAYITKFHQNIYRPIATNSSYRFNSRKMKDCDRFAVSISKIEGEIRL